MSLTTYFYDPFYEPSFRISDFNRLFNAAWDARSRDRDLQRGDESSSVPEVHRPKYAICDILFVFDYDLQSVRMDLHVLRDTDEMTATFELPGMEKGDVQIEVNNNRLVVSGQSSVLSSLDKEGYAVRERRYGKFSRTFPLPQGIQVPYSSCAPHQNPDWHLYV